MAVARKWYTTQRGEAMDVQAQIEAVREWSSAAERAIKARDVHALDLSRQTLMQYADEKTVLCRWAVNDLHRIARLAITLIDPIEASMYRSAVHGAVDNLLRKLETATAQSPAIALA